MIMFWSEHIRLKQETSTFLFSLQLHGAASPEGKIFHGTKSAADTRTDNVVDSKEERGVQEEIPFF